MVLQQGGPCERLFLCARSWLSAEARADIQEALARKGPQGESPPPIAKEVTAEGVGAADTYKTRCYQRAARCHFEKGHSPAFKCWYGLVLRREKIDLKGDNSERRRRIIMLPTYALPVFTLYEHYVFLGYF